MYIQPTKKSLRLPQDRIQIYILQCVACLYSRR